MIVIIALRFVFRVEVRSVTIFVMITNNGA